MGSPAKQELALRGLANSAGFLQSQIAERIDTRYIPRLRFELDRGVKHSLEIARVLGEVLPTAVDAEAGAEASGTDDSSLDENLSQQIDDDAEGLA